MLQSFSDWLAATPVSVALANTNWVVPTVQTIHILAIAVVMSSVLMLDLKLAGLTGRNLSLTASAKRFVPWVWGGLAVLLPTGLILIVIEPARELLSVAFQLKMLLVLTVAGLTAWLQYALRHEPAGQGPVRLVALVSLVLWVAIVTCGRWIAYVQ